MPRLDIKEERVHLRLSARIKQRLEFAATLSSQTVTDFVISSAATAAERVISEHERIVLTDEDRDIFFEAIVNPPPPKKALREAFLHYQGLMDETK